LKIFSVAALIILTGCSTMKVDVSNPEPPQVQPAPLADKLANLPKNAGPAIPVAVYSFNDKTGQRKPADNMSSLSSAVTQGAEVWVINALKEAGGGGWFIPLERIELDALVKERQLIRNTRDNYGEKENPLNPMLFSSVLLAGGIIGYDSNVAVGGVGARYLGIGAQTEYRIDTVTVSMRIVSVATGEVLLTVATEKSIASTRSGSSVFKFLDMGTKALELEVGTSANEPVNYAVRAAIEAGIIEIIYEGQEADLWQFAP
jgi:curli production assembly/transport component CsgG